MLYNLFHPYPGFYFIVFGNFCGNDVIQCVPFRRRYGTTKDCYFKWPLGGKIMTSCFCSSVFLRVSESFKQAIIVETGFPMTKMVAVDRNGLNVEYCFFVFWQIR